MNDEQKDILEQSFQYLIDEFDDRLERQIEPIVDLLEVLIVSLIKGE